MTRALVFLLIAISMGSAQGKTSEGSADLIEKAYNLTLQKDRTQAVSVLVTAIKRENASPAATREMRNALQDIGGMFLGDKAQQVYELAISFRRTDFAQEIQKLNEGLRFEPDNTQLLAESARVQILKGDCSGAADALAKTRKLNPYDERILLASAQAAVCQMDIPTYATLRATADAKKGPFSTAWESLEIDKNAKEKADSRAKDALNVLKKAEPDYPEIVYWNWKFETNLRARKILGQKYVAACKNLSAASFRRYMVDTLVCAHTAETQAETEAPQP